MNNRRLAVMLLVFAIAGCASGTGQGTKAPVPAPTAVAASAPSVPAAAPAPAAQPAATVPADDLLNAVLWSQRAAEHDLIFREVYRSATEKLQKAIADPTWNALTRDEQAETGEALPPAVILDVDETVLDNAPYEARLVRDGKQYNEFTWKKWCREEIARPLPGAVEFTRFAAAHGVAVYYVTNRAKDLDQVTLANLRKDGFPVSSDDVFLGLGTVVPGCEQYGSEKHCRRILVGRTHRVVMQFGDQLGDFVTVQSNTLDDRGKSVEPYMDWVGERWWVLPNPMYGSWEAAAFNNYWAQPQEQRRKAKIDALQTH